MIEAGGGRIYTVDEVSDMLGVPRPTLYRYLKEYAVSYARRSGRIRIPDDSVDRIRKIRELHDEGLGTDAVRRRLRGEGSDLNARLDRISESLEKLRGANSGYSLEALSPASGDMRTLLARQTLLISAVFDMSEMLEELLASTGHPRKTTFQPTLREEPPPHVEARARHGPAVPALTGRVADAPPPERRVNFGALARRRRRIVLALAALIALALSASIYLVLGAA